MPNRLRRAESGVVSHSTSSRLSDQAVVGTTDGVDDGFARRDTSIEDLLLMASTRSG